ncbi:MAG: hypothetical protein JXA66_08495 [Oligoflexia bacterium]|nr:hypothetical protein [Oligoflexia bacterium]
MFFLIFNSLAPLSLVNIAESLMVNNSHEILHGKITAKSCERFDNLIVTKYTMKIYKDGFIKKNYVNSDTVSFFILGGVIGKEKLTVPGLVHLDNEKDYIVFLEQRASLYGLSGANQGCLRVEKLPFTSEKVVIPCGRYHNSVYSLGLDKNGSYISLGSFIKKVKEIGGL